MTPESKLQKQIIDRLESLDLVVFPMEFRNKVGCPDLLVMDRMTHHVLWLEVKTETGALSAQQQSIINLFRSCKQFVSVVHTEEEAVEAAERYLW